MRFTPTIFSQLVEPLDRRRFQGIVDRHGGDAYDKSFRSFDHLIALIHAQLSGADSLRGVVQHWNAHAGAHYHLAGRELARSTLADANARRPAAVFAEAFALVAGLADRTTRSQAGALLRLIDSTPIPLGKVFDWAKSNGRIRGMKAHVLYDLGRDLPEILDITHANVNDAQIGRTVEPEPGLTYVFDKGYCHYNWWTKIHDAKAVFVTRPKTNMRLSVMKERQGGPLRGDGFTVVGDQEVVFSSKGDSKLAMPLRLIRLLREEDGKTIAVISNDIARPAVEIAQAYKARWQIELLFRWLKQHLKLRKFLGNNENAIKLQIYAAMIAYVLLRWAARTAKTKFEILRFAELVSQCLFTRRRLGAIEKPPPTNPSKKRDRSSPDQMSFGYA